MGKVQQNWEKSPEQLENDRSNREQKKEQARELVSKKRAEVRGLSAAPHWKRECERNWKKTRDNWKKACRYWQKSHRGNERENAGKKTKESAAQCAMGDVRAGADALRKKRKEQRKIENLHRALVPNQYPGPRPPEFSPNFLCTCTQKLAAPLPMTHDIDQDPFRC